MKFYITSYSTSTTAAAGVVVGYDAAIIQKFEVRLWQKLVSHLFSC